VRRLLGLCTLLAGCASAGDPPGGPEDTTPPAIVAILPESGAVLTELPDEVSIRFDEVVNERVAGTPPDIVNAVIVSPAVAETRVRWRRDRITARPRAGFLPGRLYRVELLPVVSDLRQNRLREGRVIVFSTGPAIPTGRLDGALVDWPAGRPAVRGLVEAVLFPDSLPYRTLTDSTGYFVLEPLLPGTYRVYGVMDTNNDRRRGPREAYDTVTVTVDSGAARAQLFAFVHDTLGPRLRTVESTDSLTVKLTFDQALPNDLVVDTASITIAPASDSTARLPVLGLFTQAMLDSLRVRAQRQAESAAARADTAPRAQPPAAQPPGAQQGTPSPRPTRPMQPGGRPPAVGVQPGQRTTAARAPLDSTVADRMLARRPAPSDVRFLRLERPLELEVRYVILVEGVRGLAGATGTARGQLRIQRQTVRRSGGQTVRSDTTAADSVRARPDSLQPRPDSTPARPDSTLPHPAHLTLLPSYRLTAIPSDRLTV
jgi:hypothetical protein